MVLSAAKPENICERVREPADLNPHPGPFPPPTNATSNIDILNFLSDYFFASRAVLVLFVSAATYPILFAVVRTRHFSAVLRCGRSENPFNSLRANVTTRA